MRTSQQSVYTAPTTKAFHTPTYSNIGTAYVERLIGAVGNPNSSSGGVGVAPVLIIPRNTDLFIGTQNKSSKLVINIIIVWYELEHEL